MYMLKCALDPSKTEVIHAWELHSVYQLEGDGGVLGDGAVPLNVVTVIQQCVHVHKERRPEHQLWEKVALAQTPAMRSQW